MFSHLRAARALFSATPWKCILQCAQSVSQLARPLDRLPRLYSHRLVTSPYSVELLPKQDHYLRKVLRLGENDKLLCFHPQVGEFLAELSPSNSSTSLESCWLLNILEKVRNLPEFEPQIHLFVAPFDLTKKDFRLVLEKSIELLVSHIHPYSISPTDIDKSINLEKHNDQIIEATEQSDRISVPSLNQVDHSLLDTLARFDTGPLLLYCPKRLPLLEEYSNLSSYEQSQQLIHNLPILGDKVQELLHQALYHTNNKYHKNASSSRSEQRHGLNRLLAVGIVIPPRETSCLTDPFWLQVQKLPHVVPCSLGTFILPTEVAAPLAVSIVADAFHSLEIKLKGKDISVCE